MYRHSTKYPSDKIEVRFEPLGFGANGAPGMISGVANDPSLQCRRRNVNNFFRSCSLCGAFPFPSKRESLEEAARGEPFELVQPLRRKVEDL